jgi:hypothetical protein
MKAIERRRAARISRRVARAVGVRTRFVISMARAGTDPASASVFAGRSSSDFSTRWAFVFMAHHLILAFQVPRELRDLVAGADKLLFSF